MPEQHARARRLLRELVPLAIVQEVTGSGQIETDIRYVMHPLIREVAAGMLKLLGGVEHAGAYTSFALFMLKLVEYPILMRLTVSESQQLMSDELGNIRELARVLLELLQDRRAPHQICECAAVAAALRQRGDLEQALEVEQAIALVQKQHAGPTGAAAGFAHAAAAHSKGPLRLQTGGVGCAPEPRPAWRSCLLGRFRKGRRSVIALPGCHLWEAGGCRKSSFAAKMLR